MGFKRGGQTNKKIPASGDFQYINLRFKLALNDIVLDNFGVLLDHFGIIVDIFGVVLDNVGSRYIPQNAVFSTKNDETFSW